jgi:group I intron endonuclease
MSLKLRYTPVLWYEYLSLRGEIYIITNKVTGMKYIGQTKCMKKRNNKEIYKGYLDRFSQHLRNAFNPKKYEDCSKLYIAIRTYGVENFSVHLCERCLLPDINKRERYYIRKLNTRRNGYNIDRGGKPKPYKVKKFQRRKNIN